MYVVGTYVFPFSGLHVVYFPEVYNKLLVSQINILTKSNHNIRSFDWRWSRGGGLAVYETGTVFNLSFYHLFGTVDYKTPKYNCNS